LDPNRKHFDRYEVLQQVGRRAVIGWSGYKAVFPTSAREFVTITAWNEGSSGATRGRVSGSSVGGAESEEEAVGMGTEGPWWVIASKSITSKESAVVGPPRKGYTRGNIECSGYVVRWCPAFLEENGGVVPEEQVSTKRQVPVTKAKGGKKNKTKCKIVYSLKGVRAGLQPRSVFTSICQSSPGGSVPISLVNSLAATTPHKVIKGIKKVVC
jgi:hypothetical protein